MGPFMKKIKRARALAVCLFLLSTRAGIHAAPSKPITRAEAVPSDDQIRLAFPGSNAPASYDKWGEFGGLGTPQYRYTIQKRTELSKEVGEGIYPNTDVIKDPAYQVIFKAGK